MIARCAVALGLALVMPGATGAAAGDPGPQQFEPLQSSQVQARSSQGKPHVVMLTGLPLVVGEGEVGDILNGAAQPAESFVWLRSHLRMVAVDAIRTPDLSRADMLILAQPRALSPEELVAIDSWVRSGGRVLIFADPQLEWVSRYPPGDPRAPPPVTLLDPLLDHWGLRVDLRAPLGAGRVISAGSLTATGTACRVDADAQTAQCSVGMGSALVVADADFLADQPWRSDPARHAAMAGWLNALVPGAVPSASPVADAVPPRDSQSRHVMVLTTAVLLACAVGLIVILKRNRG